MINRVFRLIAPKQIVCELDTVETGGESVIVRPRFLSICAADQRYFNGLRSSELLARRLPMALIHEACGVVAFDPRGILKIGQQVLLVPNQPCGSGGAGRENYAEPTRFCSSNLDGFSQEYVSINREFLVKYKSVSPGAAALCELFSVAVHSAETLRAIAGKRCSEIAVFGDGSVGYATALAVKTLMPSSRLIVFGISPEKLSYFSFADETVISHSGGELPRFDHAIECVGGSDSQDALESIVELIRPQGSVMLLGVSEKPVPVNTRMVLEKGLCLVGRSRSTVEDFKRSVKILESEPELQTELEKLISQRFTISTAGELTKAFEADCTTPFKTVLEWRV